MKNKRKFKDLLLQIITYLFSSFGIIILGAIFVFIFIKGGSTLSFNMIKGDYYQEVYNVKYENKNTIDLEYKEIDGAFYSSRYIIVSLLVHIYNI